MPLAIQKSAAKNYVAADSEIGSQKLCRKTMSLPIQKSAAKNRVTTDSKITAAVSLLIQKSTAKNYVVVDSEISNDGGVISALLIFFFWVFTLTINDLG